MFPCVLFKLSNGSLESNTLSIASLDLVSQGSLCFYRAVPRPTPQVCLVSWGPNPRSLLEAHAV